MNEQTQIGPRPHRQRTRGTKPITPARRRRRQRELLRAKRQNILYLLDERVRNRAGMRAVRARRKGNAAQIAERQPATHQLPQ